MIGTFNDATEASTSGTDRDSIIHCCKNEYKTAGGYIWRFEGDPFSITSERDKNPTLTCGICGSKETVRSMAMHLKWVHNVKTEDYVKQYEEFRPKELEKIKLQETSLISCPSCGKKLNNNHHLIYHISTAHPDISKREFIIKYFLDGKEPLCKCGCGQPVQLLGGGKGGRNFDGDKESYFKYYVDGHIRGSKWRKNR